LASNFRGRWVILSPAFSACVIHFDEN